MKKLQKLKAKGPKEAIKTVIRKILFGKALVFFERLGFHILPVHFYSPVPSIRELRKNPKTWYQEGSFSGIDFNIEEQEGLLEKLKAYEDEYTKLPPYEQVAQQYFGEGYGEVEAHILYAMVRHLKPATVIEVGSGISTYFLANAAAVNNRSSQDECQIICVEPYPWPKLEILSRDNKLKIIKKPVQEMDLNLFKMLKENDILFIDSSHIVKIGSDVNYLFLEVLPNLNKGVVVHIHDIFFPYPIFSRSLYLFSEFRFWTEPAIVQAFLTYNNVFKILLCSSYLHYKKPQVLQAAFSVYNPQSHLPSSLWIKKIA
jgi:predicted O-methyltransferase YrrM